MKRLITQELIIARNADIIVMTGAVAVAEYETIDPFRPPRAGAQSLHIGKGIGRGTAQFRDTHLRAEEDAILPHCPHLLKNDAR